MTDKNKIFRATSYKENVIELTSSEELNTLYEIILNEENFILEWEEAGVIKSKLIVGKDWSSKINTGDIELTASRTMGGKLK